MNKMTLVKHFDLNILEVKEGEFDIPKDTDIVYIFEPKDIAKYKKQGYFHKPYKITYELSIPESKDEFLYSIKRNKRKRILKAIRECQEKGIKIIKQKELKKETFNEWYNIYESNIESKEKGRVFADREWFDRNGHKMCGVIAKKGDMIIGGVLLTKKTDRMSISFSSSIKEYLHLGLNDILNLEAIFLAKELDFDLMERGMDMNLYGHHLSPGLFVFKTALGFKPVPKESKGDVLMKIINFDKFGDHIFFIDYGKQGLRGNIILKDKCDKFAHEINKDLFTSFRKFLIEKDKLYILK